MTGGTFSRLANWVSVVGTHCGRCFNFFIPTSYYQCNANWMKDFWLKCNSSLQQKVLLMLLKCESVFVDLSNYSILMIQNVTLESCCPFIDLSIIPFSLLNLPKIQCIPYTVNADLVNYGVLFLMLKQQQQNTFQLATVDAQLSSYVSFKDTFIEILVTYST